MSVGALEHVLVLADDIEATRDFYCEVFIEDPNGVGVEISVRDPEVDEAR